LSSINAGGRIPSLGTRSTNANVVSTVNRGGRNRDTFGIDKVYETASGSNQEWYMSTVSDPWVADNRFLNQPVAVQQSDGSWFISGTQVRMEVYSVSTTQKWLNVEMTSYVKMLTTNGTYAHQHYARGGHHYATSGIQYCVGGTDKTRFLSDGESCFVKEVNHNAYTANIAQQQATAPVSGRWMGFKSVLRNFDFPSQTYVVKEAWVDDTAQDVSGNLQINNNWQRTSIYVDTGGLHSYDVDWMSGCSGCATGTMRQRDEILICQGSDYLAGEGAHISGRNLAAFRSDDDMYQFNYLTVREITQPTDANYFPLTLVISGGFSATSAFNLTSGGVIRAGLKFNGDSWMIGRTIRQASVWLRPEPDQLNSGLVKLIIRKGVDDSIAYRFPVDVIANTMPISGEASGTYHQYTWTAESGGNYVIASGDKLLVEYGNSGKVNLRRRVGSIYDGSGTHSISYTTTYIDDSTRDINCQIWTDFNGQLVDVPFSG